MTATGLPMPRASTGSPWRAHSLLSWSATSVRTAKAVNHFQRRGTRSSMSAASPLRHRVGAAPAQIVGGHLFVPAPAALAAGAGRLTDLEVRPPVALGQHHLRHDEEIG